MYINSKPHVLLSADTTRTPAALDNGDPSDRRRAASDAGLDSGSASVKLPHPFLAASSSSPSSSASQPPTRSSFSAFVSSPTIHVVSHTPPLPALSSSHHGLSLPSEPSPESARYPAGAFALHRFGTDGPVSNGNGNDNASSSHANDNPAADSHSFFPPLYLNSGANSTPEPSLVGARGKSIPLDDNTTAHRTSALRELNNNFPSPVLRHRYTKSAGAKNSTYSQPVIVRTYSGPSPSPSSSAHYRRPSSSYRAGSRTAGSRRIPLSSPTPPPPQTGGLSAAVSSNHAPRTSGDSSKESLFSMARSKMKKSIIPWQWATNESNAKEDDEARLPPLEAFTFKGFMADLQTTTDIRADLDRIAEICARSRYSLSNQYDSHVTPHGSGAGFLSGAQPPYRSKGRKKGTPGGGVGGPTLQAVPSDDDESNPRSQRRRRGGVGGGRRRSVAYGTLETIMSSSRSSEEEKTKKKSAAEIAEEVRGRATQKATEDESGSQSPRRKNGEKKTRKSSKVPSTTDFTGLQTPPGIAGAPSAASKHPDKAHRDRRKSTSFAHAVIDRNRIGVATPAVPVSSTAALLSGPALPQTSNNLFEIHSSSNGARPSNHRSEVIARARYPPEQSPTSNAMDDADFPAHDSSVANTNGDILPPDDVAAAGFLSGLSSWIPWVSVAGVSEGLGVSQSQNHEGPSHAEGSLRELLKTVEANKPNKGKAVDRED